jgi:protein-L-isoaspartate(D-aspartate) O-methyltransferase
MVEQIARHFADTADETGEATLDERVREAMLAVPRHRFVPEALRARAYADSALPIGCGQTISQPFIVALMTQLGRIEPGARVLEIGTGSGYEAAVLAEIASEVYSVELIAELAERAEALFAELGISVVHVRTGDGFEGWPEAAPFDAILVTACASEVPQPLVDQLSPYGRLVIPVGQPRAYQELQVIRATGGGEHVVQHVLPVAFVPFVHESGESSS